MTAPTPPTREQIRLRAGAERSASARVRYRFDAALARGPWVVIGWLGALTLTIIAVSAAVLAAFRVGGINGGKRLGPIEAFWQSLLRVLDSGTFAADATWPTRLLSLAVTLAGIFLAGSLIGLIATTVDQRIEALRKGRSSVLEREHTLILGWSERVPAVVRELTIANESRKNAAIVILALEDKSVMEEALRDKLGDFRGTEVVCRSGDPSSIANLAVANYADCRSVVIVDSTGGASATVKALLAIRAVDPELSVAPIVAEVNDVATADSLRVLFGSRLATVNSDDVVAELTAQACRQRGLSSVFRELLDFDGDEIYFARHPQTAGLTFRQAQLGFARSALLGRKPAGGAVELNPDPEAVLSATDELIGVASDDSEFTFTGVIDAAPFEMPDGIDVVAVERRIIIVGWSALGPRVVQELDEFLDSHTTVEILVDPEHVDVEEVKRSTSANIIRVEVAELTGGPERVAAYAARHAFHEVIVLGYRKSLSTQDADARTLLTLLAFHRVREHEAVGPVRMVAELLDQEHAALAEATGADDFIVSDELTSLMLAQLAERLDLHEIFTDLFDSGGCTIELRPAAHYGANRAATFAQIVATASRRGETAFGYRIASSGIVRVNPNKHEPVMLGDDDQVLVLSS